jgi:hypothetical protein
MLLRYLGHWKRLLTLLFRVYFLKDRKLKSRILGVYDLLTDHQ